MNRQALFVIVGVLLIVVIGLVVVLLRPSGQAASSRQGSQMVTATNPTLDVRYQYDANLLSVGEQDPRGEYPMQLDGNGWGLYGKRIRGLGAMLENSPGGVLFDFVASEHAETYVNWYGLEMVEEEYEDATIKGKLAVHCRWVFKKTPESKDWPTYFPEVIKAGDEVQMQGWTLFSNNDLFYYYTFSALPIGETEQAAVLEILNSMEYGALFDSDSPKATNTKPRATEGRGAMENQ